jgi:alpha-galactosidase
VNGVPNFVRNIGFAMTDGKTKIAYLSNGYGNKSRCLFSSFSAADFSANISLFSKDKSLSLVEETIANNIRLKNPQSKGDLIYIAADTAEAALRGADIVILDYEALTAEMVARSFTLCERYGIAPYRGENAGVIKPIAAAALITEIFEIAEKIKNRAPGAVVVNISTPMAAVISAAAEVFPEMRIIGKADETESLSELIAYLVKNAFGTAKVRRRDIKFTISGIPSFCFAKNAAYDGNDIMPLLVNAAEQNFKNGIMLSGGETSKARFDFLLRYGIVPAVSDSVLADFLPDWYADMGLAKTTATDITEDRKNFIAATKPLKNGSAVLPVGYFTDTALIIKALCGGGNFITDTSAVNHGQIENLPDGAVVKTQCLISRNCVGPIAAGTLPKETAALCLRHITNDQTLVTAAKMRDLDIVFNAFINEPRMNLTLTKASEVFRKLLEIAGSRLSYYAV